LKHDLVPQVPHAAGIASLVIVISLGEFDDPFSLYLFSPHDLANGLKFRIFWLIRERYLTLLPAHLGELLVRDIRDAKSGIVRGIVPGRGLRIYLHRLSLRIESRSFRGAVGIADSTAVPALLGRYRALDHFNAVYRRGRTLVLEW
jgi:hypothetical protein